MIIEKSKALRSFKKEIGHANHMLTTILVGLDGVKRGQVTIETDFHAAWSPRSKSVSAIRAREFAIKSSLAWSVDCIDMYTRIVTSKPILLDDSTKKKLDSKETNQHVYKKLLALYGNSDTAATELALTDLLVNWRNRLVHFKANNDIESKSREILKSKQDYIQEKYRGVDVLRTLESFDRRDVPTFKEATSLITAASTLLATIDRSLLLNIGYEAYADRILIEYFNEYLEGHISDIFSLSTQKIQKKLKQQLINMGYSAEDGTENDVDALCDKISLMSYTDAIKSLTGGTFR